LGKVRKDKLPLESVLGKRLIQAAKQLEGETIGDPLVVAQLQFGLAGSLRNLGYAKEALVLYEKCHATQARLLGSANEEAVRTCNNLADSLSDTGQLDRAIALLKAMLQKLEAQSGRSSELWPVVRVNLATMYVQAGQVQQAIPLLEETLRLIQQQVGPD